MPADGLFARPIPGFGPALLVAGTSIGGILALSWAIVLGSWFVARASHFGREAMIYAIYIPVFLAVSPALPRSTGR